MTIYIDQGRRIMNKLQELIFTEFNLPVHFDKDYQYRNTTFFNIYNNSISDITRLSGGMIRNYTFDIRYYFFREGYGRHTHHNILSNQTERFLRVMQNNPSPPNEETTYSTYISRYTHSIDYWNLITSYIYHSGNITNVNYNPSLSDKETAPNLNVVEYTFECISAEAQYE